MLGYFNEYGLFLVFIIMFLEGLNLTGIPALVLLPAIGIFIHYCTHSFLTVVGVAVIGSILGNVTYYLVVRHFGVKIYQYFYRKFKGIRKSLDKAQTLSNAHGDKVCLVGRLIPGVRTVVSLLAGTFEVRFSIFILYSAIGILIWDLVFIIIGYLVGNIF